MRARAGRGAASTGGGAPIIALFPPGCHTKCATTTRPAPQPAVCYLLLVSTQARRDAADAVASYLRGLRARATLLHAVRAACAALGVASVSLLVVGGLSGPVVTPVFSHVALALLGLLAGAVLLRGLWPLRRLRGVGSCELLAERQPALASRARSTLELQHASLSSSPALVAAHARTVRDAVSALPPSQVVPVRWLEQRPVLFGLLCVAMSAALLRANDALRGGAFALLHPAHMRPDGLRVARVVSQLDARLVYPSYLSAEPLELHDPRVIEAPRGTTVELLVGLRVPAQQGTLALGGTDVRLSAAPNGKLFGRFVVRENAALALRAYSGGHWYEDSQARRVHAVQDHAPSAVLQPPPLTTVEAQDRVPLTWSAGDDHGLAAVELVIRAPGGPEQRQRLWSSLASDKPQRSVHDQTELVPAEIGARPGDVLLLWLEARDGDVVSGPNVTESKSISLEIATDAEQLSLRLPLLREVLDGALGALADRLETALPAQATQAEQRAEELRGGSEGWLGSLQQLIAAARQHREQRGLDAEQLQGILDRTRHELRREASLYHGGGHAQKQRTEADARVVAEHERDVLLLSDMLAQGLVDEARNLTHELSALKDHIKELLEQLKAHNSPEAQRALLAEIAKAQRRLRELGQSLARLSNRVPSEFINREALPQSDAKNALEELRAAVEAGDLDAAERQLAALGQQLDQMSEHIESGGARFREAHFGARDRALAAARQKVSMLAAEQARLAERSHELVKRAAARARSQSGDANASQEMQRAADELERDLQALHDTDQGGPEAPWLDRARARMKDAADAMRTGDMAEARAMSAAAGSSLEQAGSSLEQDARMFPGHGNPAAQRADAAHAAAGKLRKLQRQIDQATPQLGRFVGEGDREQMRADLDPQQQARKQAESLQGQLGKGPDGTPLSPDAEHGLEGASDAMRRAEHALERGDPQTSALEQQDASERLHQLEERLARKGRGGAQPGEGERDASREGDGSGMRIEGQVRIPGADEFHGPVQMRRRLLDAMREPAPGDYKAAVARYYEELLR